MTLLKIARSIALAAGLLAPAVAFAEDIDLFQGSAEVTGSKPNVLIIIDNSANWNSASQGWPGGIKQGQSELNAMKLVMSTLTGDVRVGLAMFAKGAGTGRDGGYIRYAVRDMNAANRTAITSLFTNMINAGLTSEQVATANTDYGAMMYEVFKYFSGSTPYAAGAERADIAGNGSVNIAPFTLGNLSGNALPAGAAGAYSTTSYQGPLSAAAPCGKNFVIFIGNGFPSTASVDPTTLGDSALANFNSTQIYPEGTKTTYADEWARFLYQYGAANPPVNSDGTVADNKIITYTIDVYKDQQDTAQTALFKSMAKVGGGKYFAATSENQITVALTAIFNEIQAVNSVFTSSSLPVSVNTQGTFLNQIYMGVFRPDSGGRPRWPGNLKQYKFGLTTDAVGSDEIFLADADGVAAVNSQNGFVSPTARSYWSKSTTSSAGFWAFNAAGSGGQYDSPDGDLVEKGGAGQQLRSLGPTARTVYTCSPNCTVNASPSAFATTNPDLLTDLTNASTTFSSGFSATLTRVGSVVTGVTTTDLTLDEPSDLVSISGASVTAYNGVWPVTTGASGSRSFTLTIQETPITPATSTSGMSVSSGGGVAQPVDSGAVNFSNGTVTVDLVGHGLSTGQQVTMAGANVSAGMSASSATSTTSAVGSSTTVSGPTVLTTSGTPGSPATSGNVVTITTPKSDSTQTVTRQTTTTTATTFTPCSGWTSTANCEFNGAFNITFVNSDRFTYSPPATNFGSTRTIVTAFDTDTTALTSKRTYNSNSATTYSGTSYSPPQTFTSSFGTVSLTCRGTTTPVTATVVAMTRTTASEPVPSNGTTGTGNQTVTLTLNNFNSGLTNPQIVCTTPFTINSNANKSLVALNYVAGNTANGIASGSYAITAAAGSSTAATVSFVVSVTATLTGPGTPVVSESSIVAAADSSTTATSATRGVSDATVTLLPAATATGTISATAVPTRAITSITRTDGNAIRQATVTVTTTANHGFTGQSSVTVVGADQPEYNGTYTVTANSLSFVAGLNKITYTILTGPINGTGLAAKGNSVDPAVLINWVRGVDNKDDENADGLLSDVRASIHGDVLHSRPVVINYGGTTGVVAFYGANDGTLHAVKGGQDESAGSIDGREKWAFVAPEHFAALGRLYNNSPLIKFPSTSTSITPAPTKRNYFFDGNIGVFQSADLTETHIFPTMRRGGRAIYALNVSNPDAPKFMWKKTNADTGFSELGYTWSEPKVFPMKKTNGVACSPGNPATFVRAVVFGAGYDPAEDDKDAGTLRTPTMGRGVFFLKAADGEIIKFVQPGSDLLGNTNSAKLYSFPSEATLLDTDNDGCVDRIYMGDTGGNLFRFDIGNADSALWKVYKIAALGDIDNNGGSNDRKFLFPPDAVLSVIGANQVAYVVAGSGDREQPRATAIADRFYMVKDLLQVGASNTVATAVVDSELTEITEFNNASTSKLDPTDPAIKGWKISFETGEKSVNAPLTVGGVTFFGTNKPVSGTPTSCSPNLGVARGYAVNFLSGTSAVNDRDANGTINKTDLYSVFKGGGLPPSPVSGVVQIDASKTVRFIIGSGGTGVAGSTIEGVKTQANPSGTRARVFWYFKKDD